MSTTRSSNRILCLAITATAFAIPTAGRADWNGLVDASDPLQTESYAFSGFHPLQINSNENYYDGDMGDFDGDGVVDRSLGSRYGLLMNTGEGLMTPYNGFTGYLIRGMPGAPGWGEDAYQWADIDNDGDLDNLCGGNNEPLTLQSNRGGRFSTAWQLSESALNISNTDIEGDGDVDIIIAHAFCANQNCGGPVNFSLLVNDGDGNMTEEAVARGLDMSGFFIVGAVSGDIDSDGDYDILIQRGESGNPEEEAGFVQVARNDGTGHYTLSTTNVPIGGSGFGQNQSLGDIDGDGDLDVVIARPGPSAHSVVRHAIGVNDGNGNFTDQSGSQWIVESGGPSALRAGNSALVDLDYDGDLDFVAFAIDNGESQTGFHSLQVFLNDGSGTFTYSTDDSVDFVAGGTALGADCDITDLDRDGDYDIWLGVGGDRVRIMLNDYEADDGLPADVPRDLQIEDVSSDAVTVRWSLPSFASNSTYYKVWRATTPGLDDRDRELIAIIGQPHQDEAFADPITRFTDPARLGPGVDIDANEGTISFTDDTVLPGQTYQYSVSHVGAENTESRQAPEIFVQVPGGNEDGTGPQITIIGPTGQDWWSYPRVVAHFADGGSGVDPDSIRVTFDTPLGPVAVGDDVSNQAYRKDPGVIVAALEPPHTFAENSLVTMTVQAADMEGNSSTAEETFFVGAVSSTLPTASLTASSTSGAAPFVVDFDASASDDSDGRILRWEWYFADGTTAIGRTVSHEFATGGSFDVRLVVRDNEGGVAVDTITIDVEGDAADCTLGEFQDCYSGPEGTDAEGVCAAGTQQCGPGGWGSCQGESLPDTEACNDGLDNDCDGDVDDVDTDCGGPGGTGTDGGGSSGSDGATDGSTGSGPDSAGGATDGVGDTDGAAADGSGGCGCTTGDGRFPAFSAMGLLLLLRRRRRTAVKRS